MELDNIKNGSFNVDIAEAALDRVLSDWWRRTSRTDFSLSESDLHSISKAREMARSKVESIFVQMLETTVSRRQCLARYSNIKFVSLGEDCFSRTVLTRWGIKPSRVLGEKSGPFDLSVHPIRSMAKILENDFNGYLDSTNLQFSEKLQFVVNNFYKVSFNHEVGRHFADNDFSALRETYSRRLETWRSLVRQSNHICFVMHIRQPAITTWPIVRKIWDSLSSYAKPGTYALAVLNTWNSSTTIDLTGREAVNLKDISIIDAVYPSDGYVWHRHASSPGGHAFEKDLVTRLRQVIEDSSIATGIYAKTK